MAQPLRKSKNDEFDLVPRARHSVGLSEGTTSAPADRLARSFSSSEDLAESGNGNSRGFAAIGAATVISVLAGTPLAGVAVLGGAIAIRWALLGFGNWILDNTL